jgi:hypothetical protein
MLPYSTLANEFGVLETAAKDITDVSFIFHLKLLPQGFPPENIFYSYE